MASAGLTSTSPITNRPTQVPIPRRPGKRQGGEVRPLRRRHGDSSLLRKLRWAIAESASWWLLLPGMPRDCSALVAEEGRGDLPRERARLRLKRVAAGTQPGSG